MTTPAKRTALIVGSTGIAGGSLALQLVQSGWRVMGLARNPTALSGVESIAADLLDLPKLESALSGLSITHVFFCTWQRKATEAENISVNGALLENLLTSLKSTSTLTHFALVTGTRHYLGPFEDGVQISAETPFREETPRLPMEQFYYTWEDMLFAAASQQGFTWSVHRPNPIIGYAVGNAMNTAASLAVYATICRETGRPFIFPGSAYHWDAAADVTDARQLARHLEWAALEPAAHNQAFNVINGDIFRWRWLWPKIGSYFGLEALPPDEANIPLEVGMKDAGSLWAEIARKHELAESNVERLATWWFADWDLRRQASGLTDMSKSRRLGFTAYQETPDSFFHVFDQLRNHKLIPKMSAVAVRR